MPRPADVRCNKRCHGFESPLLVNHVKEDYFHYWESEGYIGRFVKFVFLILVVCTRELMRVNFIIIHLFTEIGLLPGGSGYFTFKQNIKLITTKFKSGGLHEKHVVSTWNFWNHLSIYL